MKLSSIYDQWFELMWYDLQIKLCRELNDECHERNYFYFDGDGYNEPRLEWCRHEENCPFLEDYLTEKFQSEIDDGYLDDYEDDEPIENDMKDRFDYGKCV